MTTTDAELRPSELVSSSKMAEIMGVSVQTLYRWERAGYIKPERTVTGHRRYDVQETITASFPRRAER